MNEDAFAACLVNWESRVPVHVAGYGLERFLDDLSHLPDVVPNDVPALGDLTGQRVAHPQCHIGIDTNSSARLGADVVGVEAAGEERARDGVAKRYRHDPDSRESLAGGDAAGVTAARHALAAEPVCQAGQRRCQDPPMFTHAELRVSPQGWAAIQDAARALGELVHPEPLPCSPVDAAPISETIPLSEMGGPAS